MNILWTALSYAIGLDSFSRPFSLPGHPSPADYFHLSPSLYIPLSTHFLFYLSPLFMFPSLPYFPLPTHISKLTSLSIPDILPLLQWIIFFHHFPFPPTQRLQSCDTLASPCSQQVVLVCLWWEEWPHGGTTVLSPWAVGDSGKQVPYLSPWGLSTQAWFKSYSSAPAV